eukprot:4917839-Pyramimonas_sp.AAC.1
MFRAWWTLTCAVCWSPRVMLPCYAIAVLRYADSAVRCSSSSYHSSSSSSSSLSSDADDDADPALVTYDATWFKRAPLAIFRRAL